MPTSVSMPALGESVTEGTVTQWLKNVGDTVEVDEPLLEVSTDKVDTEIPSPVAGVLSKILVDEDETVDIGAEIAVIGGEGEETGAPAEPAAESEPEPEQASEPEPEPEQASEPEPEPESAPEPEQPAEPEPASSSAEGPKTSVSMPALGESVTEGTITRWLKSVGDTVEVDEPLLEVSTDKVDTEIPSPVAGTLQKIVAEEDETVEIGADLAVIGGEGDEPPMDSEAPAPPAQSPRPSPRASPSPRTSPRPRASPGPRRRASPSPPPRPPRTASPRRRRPRAPRPWTWGRSAVPGSPRVPTRPPRPT